MSQRWAVALLAVMTVGLMGAHAGGLLRFAYPLVAVALGVYLEGTSPSRYVVLVVWLWVLSPLVRRLGDYQAGFQDPSLIILTPYLVTAIGIGQQLIRSHVLHTRPMPKMPPGAVVFVFVIAGAAFGLPIGLIKIAVQCPARNAELDAATHVRMVSRDDLDDETSSRSKGLSSRPSTTLHSSRGHTASAVPLAVSVGRRLDAQLGHDDDRTARAISRYGCSARCMRAAVRGSVLTVPMTLWLAKPTLGRLPATCAAAATLFFSGQNELAWIRGLRRPCHGVSTRPFADSAGRTAAPGVPRSRADADVTGCLGRHFAALCHVNPTQRDTSAMSRLQGHVLGLYFVTGNPLGGGIGLSEPGIESYIGMRDSVMLPAILQFGVIGRPDLRLGVWLSCRAAVGLLPECQERRSDWIGCRRPRTVANRSARRRDCRPVRDDPVDHRWSCRWES